MSGPSKGITQFVFGDGDHIALQQGRHDDRIGATLVVDHEHRRALFQQTGIAPDRQANPRQPQPQPRDHGNTQIGSAAATERRTQQE